MWCDVAYLGVVVKSKNAIGDSINIITYPNEIYCNEKSIRASEFYQAQAVGMKPEIILEVMISDYSKEKFIKYDEEEYTIMKTYKKSPEIIELTLVRGVNDGDSN